MTEERSAIQTLTAYIVGDRANLGEWRRSVTTFLEAQSSDTISLIVAGTMTYGDAHWRSLSWSLSHYIHGSDSQYSIRPDVSYPNLVNGPIPMSEFFIRLALEMIPMLVEYNHLYSPSNEAEEIGQDVSASLVGVLDNISNNEASIAMCRGHYLNGYFGNGNLLPDDDFLWISQHAMELMPTLHETFFTAGFHRRHAEEVLTNKSAPLRTGVL